MSVHRFVRCLNSCHRYGDDGLDPAGMEAKEKPVDFTRVLAHVKAILPTPTEVALDGVQIVRIVDEALAGKFSV